MGSRALWLQYLGRVDSVVAAGFGAVFNLSQFSHLQTGIMTFLVFPGCDETFLGSRWSCFYLNVTSANRNGDNILVNVPFDQKCRIASQSIPKHQPKSGPFSPNKAGYEAPANQIFSICLSLFFILYPIRASCFLPFFALLGIETAHFMKCYIKFICIT